jgi:hypothetical protein
MNIGFWNIDSSSKKSIKDLSDSLVSLTIEKGLDIICIAESNDKTILNFLKKINKLGSNKYQQVKCSKDKLTIISRFKDTVFEDVSHLYISPRWLAHKVSIPTKITFNLVSIHFHSKLNWSENSLALECVNLSRDIQIIEENTKCNETILIGDFNMSPFENGLVSANGINAISDLNYALKRPKGRDIDGEFYKFFYNPMWNFYGDFKEPFGTCYYRIPGHISHEWHIYDQIIFRPSLKTYLENPFVEIVNQIYSDNLTKSFNRPDRDNYSDHLPIILKLKI